MTTAQKIIKYLAMAFAIFLSISIIGGICSALFSVSSILSGNTAYEMTEHAVGNNFTSLKVDISAAELEIKTGEKFGIETNHRYLTYKEKGGSLEINETKPFFASHNGMKIILTIPEKTVFDRADICTGAGSVSIDELLTKSLKIDLGAGELIVERLDASDTAEINGGAGSLTVNDGYLRNADIDMGIGELNLTSELDGKSSIDYGVGETKLVLKGSSNDYKIEIDKGIGEARIDGMQMSDDSVYGSGSRQIEIDGGVGELNITFRPEITIVGSEKGADFK